MGKLQKNELGFSVVEIVLVVVIVALIGTVGWLVYKNHHKTTTAAITTTLSTKPTTSTTTKTPTSTTSSTPQKYFLDNNQVSYTLPSGWEVATPPSNLEPPCGNSFLSTLSKCNDEAILVLKSDGFTNPDQFYVEISSFPLNNNMTAQNFFNALGLAGTDNQVLSTNLTINGNSAYEYSATLPASSDGQSNEIIYNYALTSGNLGVLVSADLFSGNHYSYVTTNNYLGYGNAVGKMANSISIK